jgi:hypothetical protein
LTKKQIDEIRAAYDKTVTVENPQVAMDFIASIPGVQRIEEG